MLCYPSGKLAITISSVSLGFYTYIVQDKRGNIMAVFGGKGQASTNYQNTKLRLCLDLKGGLELDWRGGQKRKWNWLGQKEHVHAPPIQPITFAITKHAAVRLMAQDNITLTFNCWSRACRFQVGTKLKVPKHYVVHKEPLDEVALMRNEMKTKIDVLMRNEMKTKIESILDRIANLLKFPHCTKINKLALPLFIRATIERQEHMRAVLQATVKGLDVQS
ncbi:hypothetical protein LSAT2_021546 [Lamellibrachia satsuma]|nr:hypothetical protein LSAT2_021546 [Lamellibrachia satsuma]